MAKKSHTHTARSTTARRPATTSAKVALMRTPDSTENASPSNTTTTIAPSLNEKRVTAPTISRTVPAARPAPAVPAARPASPPSRTARSNRALEAARKTTTRRTLIRAENFAYVRSDLVKILILAAIMFAFMIVLHFTVHV